MEIEDARELVSLHPFQRAVQISEALLAEAEGWGTLL
jgi:hypothetical protein